MDEMQKQLAEAEQMLGFSEAHCEQDPVCLKLIGELEETLAQARGLRLAQRRGILERAAAITLRNKLRRDIERTTLPHLVIIGQYGFKDQPELASKFRQPRRARSLRTFVRAAKALHAATREHHDALVLIGLSDIILADSEATLVQLGEAAATAERSRREHTQATAELRRVRARMARRVGLLEEIHMMRSDDYHEMIRMIRAWKPKRGEGGARGELRLIS